MRVELFRTTLWIAVASLTSGVALSNAGAGEARSEFATLAARIDDWIERPLTAAGVPTSAPADDAAFLRRVYLDLCGRTPRNDEVQTFFASQHANKRAAIIDDLLASDDHARHFAWQWRRLLMPEADTDRQLGFLAEGLELWLLEQRSSGAGFDAIVRGLVAPPISREATRPQFVIQSVRTPNPLAYIASKDADPGKIAAGATRVFLGVRLECAQCHDHPFDRWSQEQFWQQAAFFAGIERMGRGKFAPVVERDRRTATVMETGAEVTACYLDGAAPDQHAPPREAFADWIVDPANPFFARAIVNRIWAQLMGAGLVDPADDMHDGNPPSHPELLDELAVAFIKSEYNLDEIYRGLCGSATYQRSSHVTDDRQIPPQLFAHMALKPLSGKAISGNLLQAAGIHGEAAGVSAFGNLQREFDESFGLIEGVDPETAVDQALLLMNGRWRDRLLQSPTQALWRDPNADDSIRIDDLFLRTLCRAPSIEERSIVQDAIASGDANWWDVFLALCNTPEFRWNH